MQATIVTTVLFDMELTSWLRKFSDDGHGKPFAKIDQSERFEIMADGMETAIENMKDGRMSLKMRDKYIMTGTDYEDLKLLPDHFAAHVENPFGDTIVIEFKDHNHG